MHSRDETSSSQPDYLPATIRATAHQSLLEVASTGGRKTTNRPVRATAHDPVSLGARSPDDSARTVRNPTCTGPLTGPLDECEWKCGGAVFCPPVDATDHKEVDSGRPPHGRVMGPGSRVIGPGSPGAWGQSIARWDEEAALSSPQVVYKLHTDSKSKGESGHEGR